MAFDALISIHFSFGNLKFLGHLICKKETVY